VNFVFLSKFATMASRGETPSDQEMDLFFEFMELHFVCVQKISNFYVF